MLWKLFFSFVISVNYAILLFFALKLAAHTNPSPNRILKPKDLLSRNLSGFKVCHSKHSSLVIVCQLAELNTELNETNHLISTSFLTRESFPQLVCTSLTKTVTVCLFVDGVFQALMTPVFNTSRRAKSSIAR